MKLIQVAQHVDDLDRAVAFYEQLLGYPALARFDPPGLAFFDLDGTRLLLDAVRGFGQDWPGADYDVTEQKARLAAE